jgi:hypothetical protein
MQTHSYSNSNDNIGLVNAATAFGDSSILLLDVFGNIFGLSLTFSPEFSVTPMEIASTLQSKLLRNCFLLKSYTSYVINITS